MRVRRRRGRACGIARSRQSSGVSRDWASQQRDPTDLDVVARAELLVIAPEVAAQHLQRHCHPTLLLTLQPLDELAEGILEAAYSPSGGDRTGILREEPRSLQAIESPPLVVGKAD